MMCTHADLWKEGAGVSASGENGCSIVSRVMKDVACETRERNDTDHFTAAPRHLTYAPTHP